MKTLTTAFHALFLIGNNVCQDDDKLWFKKENFDHCQYFYDRLIHPVFFHSENSDGHSILLGQIEMTFLKGSWNLVSKIICF